MGKWQRSVLYESFVSSVEFVISLRQSRNKHVKKMAICIWIVIKMGIYTSFKVSPGIVTVLHSSVSVFTTISLLLIPNTVLTDVPRRHSAPRTDRASRVAFCTHWPRQAEVGTVPVVQRTPHGLRHRLEVSARHELQGALQSAALQG